jgi:hypothetical protein
MALTDWIQAAAAAAGVYFVWQQNTILRRQNQLTAHLGEPAVTDQIPWTARAKRYWPTYVMIFLIAITAYDIYDRHWPQQPWKEPAHRVVDQKFSNTTVLLDNRHFINPVFDHVTLEYEGTGPVQVDNAKFIGPVRINSNNHAIAQTLAIAQSFCGGRMELPPTNLPAIPKSP